MSIRVTVNLILDDEAGDRVEKQEDEEDIVAEFIKRLANKPVEDIKHCIVNIEDVF